MRELRPATADRDLASQGSSARDFQLGGFARDTAHSGGDLHGSTPEQATVHAEYLVYAYFVPIIARDRSKPYVSGTPLEHGGDVWDGGSRVNAVPAGRLRNT